MMHGVVDYWALLDPGALRHLRLVVAPDVVVHALRSARDLVQLVHASPASRVMVDMGLLPVPERTHIVRWIDAELGVAVLFRPATSPAVDDRFPAGNGRGVAAPVPVCDGGMDVEMLHRVLLGAAERRHVLNLITALDARLIHLPKHVRRAVARAVLLPESGESRPTAVSLAATAGVERRSLYRWARGAGVPALHLLIASGRFMRGYGMLLDTGYSVRRVSRLAGYPCARSFGLHALALTGQTPRELRNARQPDLVVEQIAARLATVTTHARENRRRDGRRHRPA